jgi:hypothetical protein
MADALCTVHKDYAMRVGCFVLAPGALRWVSWACGFCGSMAVSSLQSDRLLTEEDQRDDGADSRRHHLGLPALGWRQRGRGSEEPASQAAPAALLARRCGLGRRLQGCQHEAQQLPERAKAHRDSGSCVSGKHRQRRREIFLWLHAVAGKEQSVGVPDAAATAQRRDAQFVPGWRRAPGDSRVMRVHGHGGYHGLQ